MNKSGLKEPSFENSRTFSKKARELVKLLRFQKFAVVNVSQSRTVKQALKAPSRSTTLVKKKAIFTINVSKIEKSFQVSCDFKLNEGMTLSLKVRAFILNT